jgi:MFS family permease
VFPLLIARATARAPEARGTAAGAVAGVGAVGALVASSLTGALGDAFGMRAASASLIAWGAALCALAWSQRPRA